MKILISGGAKNGKSTLAQQLAMRLRGDGPLYYLATMIPHDDEDRQRIRRHRLQRADWGFTTVECGRALLQAPQVQAGGGTWLLDSVTALLSNEMFREDGDVDAAAPQRVEKELFQLARQTEHIVFVSDFIFADAGRYDEWTEAYRRGLARIDRALAADCDAVAELCCGSVIWHKGGAGL